MAAVLLPADYPSEMARRAPDASAIRCDGRCWTYTELDQASDAFVTVLRDAGIVRGDRIAYQGRNSDLYFPVLFGAMRAGVVLVPINWRNTATETRFVLEHSGTKLVLIDSAFLPTVREASNGALPLIVVDAEGPGGLRGLLTAATPAPRMPPDPHAPAILLYTSGTTGTPKGVTATQYALAAQRRAEVLSGHFDDWGGDEVIFSPLPNFHIGGMSWALCGFARGLPVIVTADPSAPAIIEAIGTFRVTRAFMVPTLVRALIAEMELRGIARSSLRGIHYGAAAMDPQLLDRSIDTLGCRFLQYYGMTEAGGSVTILGPSFHDSARPHLLRSVGRPLPGYVIEIRDAEARLLPTDTPGEIWIKGPSLTQNYWRSPDAAAKTFAHGWYRSGDGGKIDAEGFLYLTDRIKDMIVSGGENVYPAEVEAVLREHPAVLDCAVFGLPHPQWGEGVSAAIEMRQGRTVSADDLIAFARQHLAAYKIPRRIVFDRTLPRTASGKVQRAALRSALLDKD
jgi:acyl-CoA synthetase (AMP-forming)/AMP-acid ligase II